jgi:hypothetical protein
MFGSSFQLEQLLILLGEKNYKMKANMHSRKTIHSCLENITKYYSHQQKSISIVHHACHSLSVHQGTTHKHTHTYKIAKLFDHRAFIHYLLALSLKHPWPSWFHWATIALVIIFFLSASSFFFSSYKPLFQYLVLRSFLLKFFPLKAITFLSRKSENGRIWTWISTFSN